MNPAGLLVHHRSLVVLGVEWEESLENAVASLQPRTGPAQVILDPGTGADALVHFFLYPASAHSQVSDGDRINKALMSISPGPMTRVVLAACALTTPPLEAASVDQLADESLAGISRKYAIRALDVSSLQTMAEKHLRLVAKQLGVWIPEPLNDQSVDSDHRSILSYEDRPWSF